MLAELTGRVEGGQTLPALVWRFTQPRLAVSTGSLGGGVGLRRWVLNMTVPPMYARMDPADHLAEVAGGLGLDGPGVGLMTAVDVARRVSVADSDVQVTATVGMRSAVWAAVGFPDRDGGPDPVGDPGAQVGDPGAVDGPDPVGTVNMVVFVPARLGDAALVNAVVTAAEARAQAMLELGQPGTGTPSDAICVLCPASGEASPYGGTRSYWGSRLARAVYRAVRDGGIADGLGGAAPAGPRRSS